MTVRAKKKGPSYKQIEARRVKRVEEFRKLRDQVHERREAGKKGDELATKAERERLDALAKEIRELRQRSDDAKLVERNDEELGILTEYRTAQVRRGRTAYGRTGEDDETRKRSPEQVVALQDQRQRDAFGAWFAARSGRLSKRQIAACQALRFNPASGELKLRLPDSREFRSLRQGKEPERRTLTTGTGSSGGFLRPTGFLYELDRAMLYYGPMLQAARILRTDNGNSLPMPEVTDTGNTGALLAESTTIGSSTNPTFAAPTLAAYKMSSKPILVPAELFEDSAFDLDSELSDLLGERLGRVINTYATTGTGTSQPQGVVTFSTAGKAAASATALAFDEFINLQFSVDIAYRAGAAWMMHDNVVEALQLLKDGDDRYLWEPSLKEGQPDKLRGSDFWINNDMAGTVEASAKVALYGQFQKFLIRMVREIRLYRLTERYRDTDQEAFIAFARVDSRGRNSAAGPIKHLIMDDGA